MLLRVPRGGGARLRGPALEVADDADVAAVDDLDVGALDQVQAEVALQEEREAPARGGPAPVDAVAAGLGVLGLLAHADDTDAAGRGEQLGALALAGLGRGLGGGRSDGEQGDQGGGDSERSDHVHDARHARAAFAAPWGWARVHLTLSSGPMRRAGMLLLVLMCFVPSTAHAGTYEVWSCAGPNGEPIAADGWRVEGHAEFSSPVNGCAAGGALHAGLNGVVAHNANTETVTWHFQVPASLKIASYRLWRAAGVGINSGSATPVYWMARQSNQYVGAYVVGAENCAGYTGCTGLGNQNDRFGAANLVARGRARRRPRPVPERRLRRHERHPVRGRRTASRSGSACTGPRPCCRTTADPVFSVAADRLAARPAARSPGRMASRSRARTSAAGCRRRCSRSTDSAPRRPTWVAPLRTPRLCPASSRRRARSRSTRRRSPTARTACASLLTDVSGNTAAFGPFPITTSNAPDGLRGRGRAEPDHDAQPPQRGRSPTAAGCSSAASSRAPPRARRCAC